MSDSILTTIVLPVSLMIIMIGMGLSLTTVDFKRVMEYPKAVFIGLTNQLIILPIVGFGLAMVFQVSPIWAVGLILIAICPGGVTSNLITYVAKGDIALSITLTAIASIVTVFSIPFVLNHAFEVFMDDGETIHLDVLRTIRDLMLITVIPVGIGMVIRYYKAEFALKMEKPMRTASTVIFVVILVGIILQNKGILVQAFTNVGLPVLLLNVITMSIGYFSARIFKLNLKQSISITIESGIQNGTLAIYIALTLLNNSALTIPAAVYSLLMFFTGGFLMWYFGKRNEVG